ncbi:NUDIX hydrolase [Microbacterium hydrocarbonoxydans]|uniref:NUDIX hydrolase n=1 Tax=Microbacterium hydrocarbonoxydans TaxID=273678 RepID=UPI002040B795|nr:NUDIX hydrolase [Microbacterium hydrocarbonoxydans]MCM3779252.1 NUDIX hydrolase [Microbacterium hydrocarbonoxydans]
MTDLDDLPVAGTVVLLRPGAPADRIAGGPEVLLMRRPGRGSFAGAWVFPGGKVEERDRLPGDDEVDQARRAGIRETREEVGLVAGEAVALSLWQPPPEAPVRIRTWFFLAEAPDGELRLSADEVVDAQWVTPGQALARHATGEWTLFPPTWMTLHHLSAADSVDQALATAGAVRQFSTRVLPGEGGAVFAWDDLRLDTTALPWTLGGG